VLVQVPRNACGFFEFWRAEELIALGRERAAQAMAAALQGRHMAARAQGR
jgi:NTE family protein